MSTETEQTPDNDFDAAFDSAVAADAPTDPVTPAAAADPVVSDPAPAGSVEGTPAPAPAPPPPPPDPAALPAAGSVSAPANPEAGSTPEGSAAEPVVAKWAEPEPATPDAAATPTETVTEVPGLSAEDAATLQSYQEDFPEIYKAETIRQNAAMQQAFGTFSQQLGEFLAPILAQVGQQATTSHEQAIANAHPDYQEVTPKLMEWVGQQPPFMRDTFNQVLQQGNTQQVVDLLTHYKRSSGQATPVTAPAAAPAPAVQQAAAALAPVQTGRGSPSQKGADMDDFDGAFAEALANLA